MDVSLEGLVIGVFAVLPGFLAAAIRAVTARPQHVSTGDWLAGSVVASLVLNALVFGLFAIFSPVVELDRGIGTLGDAFGGISGWLALEYLAALYGAAIGWGFVSGLAADYAPRALAYRLRLSPVAPAPNVFSDSIDRLVGSRDNRRLAGQPAQQVPWLLIRREKATVLGRLRRGSVDFAVDEPFEVFLEPARVTCAPGAADAAADDPAAAPAGVYMRILPEDVVEVLTAPASWDPFCELAEAEPAAAAEAADDGGGSRDY